jgi:hypothetical protein
MRRPVLTLERELCPSCFALAVRHPGDVHQADCGRRRDNPKESGGMPGSRSSPGMTPDPVAHQAVSRPNGPVSPRANLEATHAK